MRLCRPLLSLLPAVVLAGCASEHASVASVLDDFHDAASKADEARYFGHLDENAVFLGTDATERWTKDEFLAYAHPHFEAGDGWTFVPIERHIETEGNVAWFDERLASEHLGECRGTGVLTLEGGRWRLTQYNLTIPIPNDLAREFVARIREAE
ncbi:MAG: nuclear transport factor 2 family protein [Phycisphaerales bacterium]|nr:nuclear transport factor 2 family protein [Phycisphaerales bacterium]